MDAPLPKTTEAIKGDDIERGVLHPLPSEKIEGDTLITAEVDKQLSELPIKD